jgi:4-oxalomesaconate tautomerase
MQKSIPYMHFRGGSSKGLYFNAADLPTDEKARYQTVLAALEGAGLGDLRQIDGLGGGNSLSSKVAIVSLSESQSVDLQYFFIQGMMGKGRVSTVQTCGNILAGVVPFAIESGMIPATHPVTRAKVGILNTGGICEIIVQTPHGQVEYGGNVKIDGVLGTAAPIICNYLDTMGATCGQLLPTGNRIDVIDGYQMTCIDNGMPVVLLRASDFGLSGYESKAELDAMFDLKQILEKIRCTISHHMNLGDVREQSIPKMCLIAPAQQGGLVTTRMFIPHVCHDAIGVLAAISVATACILPDTVAKGMVSLPKSGENAYSIEHPSGEMTVYLEQAENQQIQKSGVVRTARLLSKGVVFIP